MTSTPGRYRKSLILPERAFSYDINSFISPILTDGFLTNMHRNMRQGSKSGRPSFSGKSAESAKAL
ncbi:MAG: hypothetical protein AUF79_19800 [Crenarchaeota archaeon 13_1_20CM_2_51_8]|nr:MAG: hypothetical protein AUJ07_01355 [Crenarchaeota archaeon 13_1_40CM_3_53_5]OLE82450.1 MAG: hypothetical protein AUF79_19800 [Crenarchaeota archaeon 13_1_20CM_2_51_8]